jgi:hypothetical protein
MVFQSLEIIEIVTRKERFRSLRKTVEVCSRHWKMNFGRVTKNRDELERIYRVFQNAHRTMQATYY